MRNLESRLSGILPLDSLSFEVMQTAHLTYVNDEKRRDRGFLHQDSHMLLTAYLQKGD
jgi:hypothetical protein